MSRVKPTTAITVFVYAALILFVGFALVGQQLQINSDDSRYNQLLGQYSNLYRDCATASTCNSTAPAPSLVIKGTPGANGQNASDAQVLQAVIDYCNHHSECSAPTGSEGIAGVMGAVGLPGATGLTGLTGSTGANGADGQPPYGWTVTTSKGNTTTCVRASNFDPAKPTYTCVTVVAPTPTPTP